MKHQVPSFNLQRSSKVQASNYGTSGIPAVNIKGAFKERSHPVKYAEGYWCLEIGVSLELGTWCFE
jgi:hypothetical protein